MGFNQNELLVSAVADVTFLYFCVSVNFSSCDRSWANFPIFQEHHDLMF